VLVHRDECAGQGAHREVGSEGFAAKRRAVAECCEPVGQIQVIPSLHYGGEGSTWDAWAHHKGVSEEERLAGRCVANIWWVERRFAASRPSTRWTSRPGLGKRLGLSMNSRFLATLEDRLRKFARSRPGLEIIALS
jgi:hypothetical protein